MITHIQRKEFPIIILSNFFAKKIYRTRLGHVLLLQFCGTHEDKSLLILHTYSQNYGYGTFIQGFQGGIFVGRHDLLFMGQTFPFAFNCVSNACLMIPRFGYFLLIFTLGWIHISGVCFFGWFKWV